VGLGFFTWGGESCLEEGILFLKRNYVQCHYGKLLVDPFWTQASNNSVFH